MIFGDDINNSLKILKEGGVILYPTDTLWGLGCDATSSAAIENVVRRSLVRAGLNLDFKGAHLLRHTLATNMLRRGATFTEIGEILRHQHPSTTEIYAKVDIEALRAIAQPWPRGEA